MLENSIPVPLKAQRSNPYDVRDGGEMDNIIAVIAGDECGFAYYIDMDYKGKPDQISDFFYYYQGEQEDFEVLCGELDIDFYRYSVCYKCKKVIYGCYTFDDTGQDVHEDCLNK